MTRRDFLGRLAGASLLPYQLAAGPASGALQAIASTASHSRRRSSETKYLLLDSRLHERLEDVRLVLGKVEKSARNPLFIEDKPWEVRFDNLYANVLFDEAQQVYKCWYNPFIIDEVTSNTPPAGWKRVPYGYKPKTREMGLCYGGSDGPHTGFRAGGLGLATLRPDGFAGFEPTKPSEVGTVVTKPVECAEQRLGVSVDAVGGALRVAVLDADGSRLRGLSLDECVPMTANTTDGHVTWRGRRSLSAPQGKPVRLQFELRAARLYAFAFGSSAGREAR